MPDMQYLCTATVPLAHNAFMIKRKKAYFIAVDSDGCVFDTMEIKHKECFCPATIKHFRLQAVSRYAREAWEFVNLYSRERGTNRFPALISVLDQLRVHPEVVSRSASVPTLPPLRQWIAETTKLGNPELLRASIHVPALQPIHDWSNEINARVKDMVAGIPPFPVVRRCLKKALPFADMIVSSGTPLNALHREWEEHGLKKFVKRIAGQEDGTKTQHLAAAAGGHYEPERMLMIGDAPGDLAAARNVGACFYPIIPGQEKESWQRLLDEGLNRFLECRFTGDYQNGLIHLLEAALPLQAPWVQTSGLGS